jgi:hypothetical protein
MKNLTPSKIYGENKELIDSFSDTLANFSPISINIASYWNKDQQRHHSMVWTPDAGKKPIITYVDPFGFLKGPYYGFEKGAFLGGQPSKTKSTNADGSCQDKDDRFFINAQIGVQDKLAMTYMNNFYSAVDTASRDTVLRHRLYKLAKTNKTPTSELFGNTNVLFDEEKSAAGKTFIEKKGTELGVKYAMRSAHDAEIQGKSNNYNIKIINKSAFEYHIESNISEDVFEKFVKPLSHPIGLTYLYKSILKIQTYKVDTPLKTQKYASDSLEVVCLCQDVQKAGSTIIRCGGSYQPQAAVIATKDGKGLFGKISQDEVGVPDKNGVLQYNVLVDYDEGFAMHNNVSTRYRKYILANENYLIEWSIPGKVQDQAPTVEVIYYRRDFNSSTGYSVGYAFPNKYQCSVKDNIRVENTSTIKEEFQVRCSDSMNGPFTMLKSGETTPQDPNADADGFFRGFQTSKQKDGGLLE